MEIIRKIYLYTQLFLVFGVFIFVGMGVILLPGIIISDYRNASVYLLVIASAIMICIWLLFFVLLLDALGYIYGTKRPIYFPYVKTNRIMWVDSHIKTSSGLIMTCLASFLVTIYSFAVLYGGISSVDPLAFNIRQELGLGNSIYFSITTAATVGYGDIFPCSSYAKILTSIEIIVSYLYAVFIFSAIASIVRDKKTETGSGT